MEEIHMKKIFAIAASLIMVAASVTVFTGCDIAKETGNKAVSEGKEYLKSELGVDGDASTLKSKAGSYLQNELGLNGDNDVIAGTWKQSDNSAVWTFDGKKTCHLKDASTDSDGTYKVDVNEATVTVEMDGTTVYSYKLRKTLSNETLELTSDSASYKLKKQ